METENNKVKNVSKIGKKEIKNIRTGFRFVIQLVFFIFYPSIYAAAFSGVKYIFLNMGMGKGIEINSFVSMLIALTIYTFVFGRFFCGFACAFGALGDWVRAIFMFVCRKLKKKNNGINPKAMKYLRMVKYAVLFCIVMLCYMDVYKNLAGYSPWDAFSLLHGLNFKLAKNILGVILLALIIVGMCLQERFFCQVLCPMGAIFAMLPSLPFFNIKRNRSECIKNCSACSKNCPAAVELPDSKDLTTVGECFQCHKCLQVCPKGNVSLGILENRFETSQYTKKAFIEMFVCLVKAIILLVIFITV